MSATADHVLVTMGAKQLNIVSADCWACACDDGC